ncbi:hypothetical protein [Bradyrhizobium sp.]|uniref:hypothetical protein n=1 Tax=Bradyrhizobium sp. TaxID=376 RepID=UPI002B703313|nr:hypothetical protein [Bradyrhizobium sp.]HMM88269.1 hypothetical protein [Bradyrhizobium sp.]
MPHQTNLAHGLSDTASDRSNWRRDLAMVLRRYGLLGLDADGNSVTRRFSIVNAGFESVVFSADRLSVVVVDRPGSSAIDGLEARAEAGGGFLYRNRSSWFRKRVPAYRALLPHVSFSGKSLTPVLMTADGRTVVGWWDHEGRQHLIIGLSVVEETVRYTQGDPQKVFTAKDKTLWGSGHERSAYLYEDNIVPKFEMVPWADRLGFLLARLIADASGLPLLEPLPGGARGAILLTGDDDQAFLEKYDEQLGLLGDFPMTYIMLPHTKHTAQTLSAMPANIEFGVHIDALPDPAGYPSVCRAQTEAVRSLVGKPARTVRNHGHLNQGYWGYLPSWEECGLVLDLNTRGLDGTCPMGSYLPFRFLRQDGSWSSHRSLFSTFSDSMYYLQKWSTRQQVKRISGLAEQIDGSDPGVIVMNLHPQNVSDFHDVHRTVIELGRQKGWTALGAESYIDWLTTLDAVSLVESGSGLELHCEMPIENLTYRWPGQGEAIVLPAWKRVVSL